MGYLSGVGRQQKVGIQVGRSEKVGFYKGTFRAQTRYDRTFSQFFGTFYALMATVEAGGSKGQVPNKRNF